MKNMLLIAVVLITAASCSTRKTIAIQAEVIECQDSLIRMMIQDNRDYHLDILMETDIYWEYIETKEKYNNLNK